jgi:hypothetical protein
MFKLQKLTPTPNSKECIIYLPNEQRDFISVSLNVHVINVFPNRLLHLPCTKFITTGDYPAGRCPVCDRITHSINLNNSLKERHDFESLDSLQQRSIKSYYAKYSPAPHATQYTYVLLASILMVGDVKEEPTLKIQRMSKTHLNNLAKQADSDTKSLGGLECVVSYGVGHPSDIMREAIKTRIINKPSVIFKSPEIGPKLSILWKQFQEGGAFQQITSLFPEFQLTNKDSLEYLASVDWESGNTPFYGESPIDRVNRVHVYDPKVD